MNTLAQVLTDAIAGVRQQIREKIAERNVINIQITALTQSLAGFQQARNTVNGRDFPLGLSIQANANITNTMNGWNTKLARLRADLARVTQEIADLCARIVAYTPQAPIAPAPPAANGPALVMLAPAPPAANGGGPAPVLGRRAAPEGREEGPARRRRWG
jgi:hypothetical protein